MRFFNTAGPVQCDRHYCLLPLERFNLDDVLLLIEQQKYFVLHAPRQTGKTSAMPALMAYLNRQGRYTCLYVNVEVAQSAGNDVRRGIKAILGEIAGRSEDFLRDSFMMERWSALFEQFGEDSTLNRLLTQWAEANPKPLVLLGGCDP